MLGSPSHLLDEGNIDWVPTQFMNINESISHSFSHNIVNLREMKGKFIKYCLVFGELPLNSLSIQKVRNLWFV